MTKKRPVTFYIEKELLEAAFQIATEEQVSGSAYIRSLILTDLKSKGHLSEELVETLL